MAAVEPVAVPCREEEVFSVVVDTSDGLEESMDTVFEMDSADCSLC